MKKQASTLSLIALAAFSIWQYFTEHKKDTKPAPTTPQQQTQSAAKNTNDFGNYDVVMRDDAIGQNKNAPVDYYMLALSWSPAFCEKQRAQYGNNLPDSAQYQCDVKNQFGWVVHGLWPQNANARSVTDQPRFCKGDLAPLPVETLEPYLSISPGAKLLQGEWEKHGSCAFDSAEAYFKQEKALFESLSLPNEQLSRKELFQWMKQNNPQLKGAYLGASHNELFICYDRQWQVIDCPK